MGDLINKISDKLLSNKDYKEEKLDAFDKTLQKIVALPEDQKTGDLKDVLIRHLKLSGLI